MEISKYASKKHSGAKTETIVPTTPAIVEWDECVKQVRLCVGNIQDVYTARSHYDWNVFLSFDEIASALKVLSCKAIQDCPDEVKKELKRTAVHLARLLACVLEDVPASMEKLHNQATPK